MRKQSNVLIPFLAISVVLALGYKGFGWENNLKGKAAVRAIDSFVTPEPSRHEAWQVLENYLEFARTHNLAGVKSFSHQISPACADSSRVEECFALMDSVYNIASLFKQTDFKHIQEDGRQIVMYTDGPWVAILFFTKDLSGTPKMLGLRFCLEIEDEEAEPCAEATQIRRDEDSNGWWDSVESLFYPDVSAPTIYRRADLTSASGPRPFRASGLIISIFLFSIAKPEKENERYNEYGRNGDNQKEILLSDCQTHFFVLEKTLPVSRFLRDKKSVLYSDLLFPFS